MIDLNIMKSFLISLLTISAASIVNAAPASDSDKGKNAGQYIQDVVFPGNAVTNYINITKEEIPLEVNVDGQKGIIFVNSSIAEEAAKKSGFKDVSDLEKSLEENGGANVDSKSKRSENSETVGNVEDKRDLNWLRYRFGQPINKRDLHWLRYRFGQPINKRELHWLDYRFGQPINKRDADTGLHWLNYRFGQPINKRDLHWLDYRFGQPINKRDANADADFHWLHYRYGQPIN